MQLRKLKASKCNKTFFFALAHVCVCEVFQSYIAALSCYEYSTTTHMQNEKKNCVLL